MTKTSENAKPLPPSDDEFVPGVGHNNGPPLDPPPDPLALIDKRGLAELLSVNYWTVDRWRKNPEFPQPVWLTGTTPRWRRGEIARWLASRPRGGLSPDWRPIKRPAARKRRRARR